MKFIEKIIKTLFNIIIIIVVLLAIIVAYNFFQINILKKQYSDFFGYTFFEVSTGSMSPTIEINDVILVKITQDVKKDDIITYIYNNEIITHRIIDETPEGLITKGDANNADDRPIEKSNVIGKVIKTFSKFGVWVKVATDTKVIASIIITMLLFGLAISGGKSEKQKEEESFSRFMRKRREKKNGKSKEKKKS